MNDVPPKHVETGKVVGLHLKSQGCQAVGLYEGHSAVRHLLCSHAADNVRAVAE